MVKSKVKLICPKCKNVYKSTAWFEKHKKLCLSIVQPEKIEKKKKKEKNKNNLKNLKTIRDFKSCNIPVSADLLPSVFNFEDDFFGNKYFTPSFPNYLGNLENFGHNNLGLKILHLNINSLFLKNNEFNEVVELGLYDIISLNETKLDESIPFSFFSNSNYTILRRDRLRDGGGIMVLLKKSLKICKSEISKNFNSKN